MAARISKADYAEKVFNSKIPVLVDFYSDSCVACKKLAPALGELEEIYENRLTIYKVNTNFDAELAEANDVTANPTLILYRDGEELDRKVGALRPAELTAWIEEFL
jgi:thioredoxin 1